MTAASSPHTVGERVSIVAGLRTPFARQLTAFADLSAIDLGILVTRELLNRVDLDPALIERVVYGKVGILPEAPNIAREVVLGAGLSPRTDAYSVSRACATSFQAVVDIAQAIAVGEIEIGLAGGADSTSVLPVQLSPRFSRALIHSRKARTLGERFRQFSGLRYRDLRPRLWEPRDYTTRLMMGDIAEQMAKTHHISREEQDRFALRSHQLAQRAWDAGKLDDEVMPVSLPEGQTLVRDNNIRPGLTLEQLAKLVPLFDRREGSVTAGNATPLTDGAATLLVMREQRARDLNCKPLGFIRAYAFTAIDPAQDALLGPSYATPLALDRAGLKLHDLRLVTMHEAFAAQALANIKLWPSRTFAREQLGRDEPIGELDWDKFNTLGGSLAYGHPFAATGARMLMQTLDELRRQGGGFGLVTACAAGGIGAAMVLEVSE